MTHFLVKNANFCMEWSWYYITYSTKNQKIIFMTYFNFELDLVQL